MAGLIVSLISCAPRAAQPGPLSPTEAAKGLIEDPAAQYSRPSASPLTTLNLSPLEAVSVRSAAIEQDLKAQVSPESLRRYELIVTTKGGCPAVRDELLRVGWKRRIDSGEVGLEQGGLTRAGTELRYALRDSGAMCLLVSLQVDPAPESAPVSTPDTSKDQ